MRFACAVAGFFLLATGALFAAGEFGDDTVTTSDAPRPDGVRVSNETSRSGARDSLRPSSDLEPTRRADEATPEDTPEPEPERSLEPSPESDTPTPSESVAPEPTVETPEVDPLSESPSADLETSTAPLPDTPSATSTGGSPPSTTDRAPADRVAPQTTLASGPTEFDDSDQAAFSFQANEAATFTCSIDGSAYRACGSGTEYDDLDPGWHDFAVRATDRSGNVDATPATWRWHTSEPGN